MKNKAKANFIELSTLDNVSNAILNDALKIALNSQSENCDIIHLMMALCKYYNTHENTFESNGFIVPDIKDMDAVYGDMILDELIPLDLSINSECEELNDDKELADWLISSDIDIISYISETIYDAIGEIEDKAETAETTDKIDINSFARCIIEHSIEDDNTVELFDRLGISLDNINFSKERPVIRIPRQFKSIITDMSVNNTVKSGIVYGVDEYVDKAFEILSRKVKANPCLIGQPGVGKTSIVYRLVQRVLSGDVPKQFSNTNILSLNTMALMSNTKYKGNLEEQLTQLIDWLSCQDVILFIDEIHSLIGTAQKNDGETLSNYLKPVLDDGTIRIIGATTLTEYHKSLELDKALNRRIQTIEIKEPSEKVTYDIVKNSISDYSKYHNVEISDALIKKAIHLSGRYMKSSYFPDKAFTVIDQACAKTKIAGLKEVDENGIYAVISDNTGIDINKLSNAQAKKLLTLEETIGKQIVGQSEAVSKVCKAIRRSKAGTRDENRPLATFMFIGPTGVGKTELSKVLSAEVIPSRESFIKIDMSEYSEKASVTRLIGASPNYIGYGEGGHLTEQVKHNPYSLILFDEIEKACEEVYNVLLQLLDEGRLTDGQGETVDFTNCIIIMTSNAGLEELRETERHLGFGNITSQSKELADDKIKKALEGTFKPEFLNRFDDIISFNKLEKRDSQEIVKLMLNSLSKRLEDNRNIGISFSDSIIEEISEQGFSSKYGARNLRRKIQDIVEDELSYYILDGTIKDGSKYTIDYDRENNKIKVI